MLVNTPHTISEWWLTVWLAHRSCLSCLPLCPSVQIPDLEEEARDADLTSAVAEAPNVRSNRVQALQELDQQILFQLPSAMV